MKALLVACSESCIVDAITNRISIVNVFEDLRAVSFPLIVAQVYTLAVLRKEQGDPDQSDGTVAFTLGGYDMWQMPVRVDFQTKPVTRAIAHVQGLPIPGPGLLKVAFKVQGVELGAWHVNVQQLPGANLQPVVRH
jgi:hypothetical protein